MSCVETNKLFYVPYNGEVSLTRYAYFREGRKAYGPWVVAWYDDEHRVVRAGTIKTRVAQVDLLRAIYRAGYSVLTMSQKDIKEQGKRSYGGGIYPKRVVISVL